MARLWEKTIVYDTPTCEKIGDTVVIDKPPPAKITVPQIKCGTKRIELTLHVDGPDNGREAVEKCAKGTAVGTALTALVFAFTPGTIILIPGALKLFLAAFAGCLGRQYSVMADPVRDHWVSFQMLSANAEKGEMSVIESPIDVIETANEATNLG